MSAQPNVIPPPSRSQRSKDLGFRLALLACLAIAIGLALADLRHARWSVLIALFPYSFVPHLATFLVVLSVNAFILRRLGYRWRMG